MLTVNYYNDFFEIGQQKINFSLYELSLPDDDPVYTLKKVMEDLNFSGLLANCSDKGRTGYNYVNEGRSYAERAVKAGIQCTDSSRELFYCAWLCK